MGASASANAAYYPPGSKKKSEVIDQFLMVEKAKANKHIKLLLLGRPNSGKSTLARQIRIIHNQEFSVSERMAFKQVLRQNMYDILHIIVKAITDLNIDKDEEVENLDDELFNYPRHQVDQLVPRRQTVKKFLVSASFHQCIERRWEYNLPSPALYLLEAVDRILSPAYVPCNDDILRCRVSTCGLQETSFKFKGFEFKMVDVGIQKSDLIKWIHYFDNVSALIYAIDISCYDQEEDDETGKRQMSLINALALFNKILNHHVFNPTISIVFLNKTDIFRDKLKHTPLDKCFTDYRGKNNFEESSQFLQWRVEQMNIQDRDMYCHLTTATDTNTTRHSLNSVIAIILQNGQSESQLY